MSLESEEPKDLWDNETSWNVSKPKKFVPLTVESFKELKKSSPLTELETMASRYRKAFKTVYNSLPEWRKKEVDNYTKGDTLPLKGHERDFAQRVAVLAEKQ